MHFLHLKETIENHLKERGEVNLGGISAGAATFFLSYFVGNSHLFKKSHLLLVYPTLELAESSYEIMTSTSLNLSVKFYSGLEVSPYRGILSSEQNLLNRLQILFALADNPSEPMVIITTPEALRLKTPPPQFFLENRLTLERDQIISPEELAKNLQACGFVRSSSVEEPGTFSSRGEIFDIYPLNRGPFRIHYFDTLIESIIPIDPETKRGNKDSPIEKLTIAPSPGCVLWQSKYNLRESIPMPQTVHKGKFERRKQVLDSVSSKILFEDYPVFLPLFFKPEERKTLLDFLPTETPLVFIDDQKIDQSILEFFEELRVDFESTSSDPMSESLVPSQNELYQIGPSPLLHPKIRTNEIDLSAASNNQLSLDLFNLNLEKAAQYLLRNVGPSTDRYQFTKSIFKFLKEEFAESGTIIFGIKNQNAKDEINFLLEENGIHLGNRVSFLSAHGMGGFFYPAEKTLLLTEADLFSGKKNKVVKESKKSLDLFAEQIATLKVGDFVVHSEHGIGKYLGLESLSAGGTTGDFMTILYADNDKVYVPVYRMNLVQKQSDGNVDQRLASLRTNKFEQAKERAREAAKKLAFDLVKLQAERASSKAFAFSPPDHLFKEFELAFPYKETPDQDSAIVSVLESMQKELPMDHLVCGDVGFGKTEVALRAAFKAVLDKKQVAILVPTTILALQHFNTFKERMKEFPIVVEFLSRFKSGKEAKEIEEKIKDGKIDILIGTHKLLSGSIQFKDLGLVIIDEEQRFGVGHKEKLKLFKSSIDVLTLTATPIPRTLQMAFLGLRDLSLIQTPPPKRQSIKTYVIKNDDHTLAEAIRKEIHRGGQIFFVHNRVHDLGLLEEKIKELVPEATIITAHGQMPEKELEKRMVEFYNGKYQILLSTTIIESGLDIPNANTLIVDRADTFGLSQLHQLRGRIGRSDKKAYAYFMVPQNRNLTPIALERLKALQTYADMGSGFSIASSDLEIRGAGDLLGAEQSGHIESVGLELYMELLKEAIAEIKGERKIFKTDLEIQTPNPAFIPAHYIAEASDRLKFYKRLSNCQSEEELNQLQDEMLDLFGPFPSEAKELFFVLECRTTLKNCALKSLKTTAGNMILQFDKKILDKNETLRNRIIDFFLSRPKIYQFSPDYRVTVTPKNGVSKEEILGFAKEVAKQLL